MWISCPYTAPSTALSCFLHSFSLYKQGLNISHVPWLFSQGLLLGKPKLRWCFMWISTCILLYFLLSLLTYLLNSESILERAEHYRTQLKSNLEKKLSVLSLRMFNLSKYIQQWLESRTTSGSGEIHRELTCLFWGENLFSGFFLMIMWKRKILLMMKTVS